MKAGPGNTCPAESWAVAPKGWGASQGLSREDCAGDPQNLTVQSVAWARLQQCHLGACGNQAVRPRPFKKSPGVSLYNLGSPIPGGSWWGG